MQSASVLEEAVKQTRWNDRYAQRTQGMSSSVIRELLKYTQDPEMISFAGGLPGPEVFPLPEIEAGLTRNVQEIPERQVGHRHGRASRRLHRQRQAELHGRTRCGDGQVTHASGEP